MPDLDIMNAQGETVGKVSLPDAVFAAPVKRHLLHEAVRHYRAVGRRGTHDTKNRTEVAGGSRKPWRQKHTGRARHGSTRSPLWRTGGTVHGPTPRDYSYRLPVKVRRSALCAALSLKAGAGKLIILDAIELASPKTRDLKALIEENLGLKRKVLIADSQQSENLALAARNNPRLKAVRPLALNAYDVLNHDYLVLSREAAERVGEVLAR